MRAVSREKGFLIRCRALQAAILRGDTRWDDALLRDPDFWRRARMDGVTALLWHAAQQDGDGRARLAADVVTDIAAVLREQAVERSAMRRAASEVLAALCETGVDAILLRGLALAESLYPRDDLRMQSDIDLLVAPEAMGPALKVLRERGFRPINAWQPHLLARETVLIDLHDEPLGVDRIRSWRWLTPLKGQDFFAAGRHGTVAGAPVRLISDELQLPWLCFHALKHSFERMVWLWDVALLCRRIGAQGAWEAVLTRVEALRLQRPCYFTLRYVDEHLGGAVPEEVLTRLRPHMDWRECGLLQRHLRHEQIPFLAERIFARMLPGMRQRWLFWRETVVPRPEVRAQIAAGGCVRCTFIRTRLRQLLQAVSMLGDEIRGWLLASGLRGHPWLR